MPTLTLSGRIPVLNVPGERCSRGIRVGEVVFLRPPHPPSQKSALMMTTAWFSFGKYVYFTWIPSSRDPLYNYPTVSAPEIFLLRPTYASLGPHNLSLCGHARRRDEKSTAGLSRDTSLLDITYMCSDDTGPTMKPYLLFISNLSVIL